MANFEIAVGRTLAAEGGYYKNSATGEVVNFGITAAFLGGHGLPNSDADVQALTVEEATALYHAYFWAPLHAEDIADQMLANKVFDIAVNQGLGPSAKMLQQAVNDLQLGGTLLQVDGVIGPKTVAAVNALPPSNLLTQFRALAEARYQEIAANNPALTGDLPGWLARLAS